MKAIDIAMKADDTEDHDVTAEPEAWSARRVVLARDKTCRFPGCSHTNTDFLQPHHLIHWADGGETDIGNLVALCSRHHRLHHEGGYTVHKCEDGEFVFRNADGRVIPKAPPYRPAHDEDLKGMTLDADGDLSDETYRACIEQMAARHASREMYEGNSVKEGDVEEKCSYISRGGCGTSEMPGESDRVRESAGVYVTSKRCFTRRAATV